MNLRGSHITEEISLENTIHFKMSGLPPQHMQRFLQQGVPITSMFRHSSVVTCPAVNPCSTSIVGPPGPVGPRGFPGVDSDLCDSCIIVSNTPGPGQFATITEAIFYIQNEADEWTCSYQ